MKNNQELLVTIEGMQKQINILKDSEQRWSNLFHGLIRIILRGNQAYRKQLFLALKKYGLVETSIIFKKEIVTDIIDQNILKKTKAFAHFPPGIVSRKKNTSGYDDILLQSFMLPIFENALIFLKKLPTYIKDPATLSFDQDYSNFRNLCTLLPKFRNSLSDDQLFKQLIAHLGFNKNTKPSNQNAYVICAYLYDNEPETFIKNIREMKRINETFA